jgi:hypothetical protein
MKTLIKKKATKTEKTAKNSKKTAQCCAKISPVKVGCHD